MTFAVCGHRWRASRVDVPDSVPVNHVCGEPWGHEGRHVCSCGAATERTE